MSEPGHIHGHRAKGPGGGDVTRIHFAAPLGPAARVPWREAQTSLREAKAADLPFLQEMCYLAMSQTSGRNNVGENIPTFEEARVGEAMGAYLGGWGRRGDYGVIAVNTVGVNIGAAWYRRYVQRYPYELTLAVREEHRRQGVGGLLLRHLLAHAGQHNRPELCLKVRKDNDVAISLYKDLGFGPTLDENTHIVMVASTGGCTSASSSCSGVALA